MSNLLRAYERGVLRVTVNRAEKRNALSREVLQELKTVFEAHATQEDLKLAVIAGAGELAFSSGGDLDDLGQVREEEDTESFAASATAALDAIRLFPVPTIAALNGIAIGGGAELAVACDMRLAASHASIGFVHATLNISTAWGGGADLMRLVGYGRGLELLATGRILSADEAQTIGLVNQVAPTGAPFVEFVDRFLDPMKSRQPGVMRALKAQAISERFGRPVGDRREGDQQRFVQTWISPEHWQAADGVLAKDE